MTRQLISRFLGREVAKRWSLLRTAAVITVRPSAFSERIATEEPSVAWPALRFFLMAVGVVLAVEALFSVVFDTAFSDLVHHSFPVFVALSGGVAVYLILKLLFTRGIEFNRTVQSTLYVGGAALIFMVTAIFGLLAADFSMNFESVMGSGCRHRTIMCLLSGNMQYGYEFIGEHRTIETQGWSYGPILIVVLLALFHYTHVLSTFLKRRMGVARWRTYLASIISILLLSPTYLILLNTIYRALYGST